MGDLQKNNKMEIQTGQRVRIREDLVDISNGVGISDEMCEFEGEYTTIIRVDGDEFTLDIDGGRHRWEECLVELIPNEIVAIGNKVRVKANIGSMTNYRFLTEELEFAGAIAEITWISKSKKDNFKINLDDGNRIWHNDLIEEIIEEIEELGENIIENYSDYNLGTPLKINPLVNEFNKQLQECKFKKVLLLSDSRIDEKIIEEHLTIRFMPRFSNVEYAERDSGRTSFFPLKQYLNGLVGNNYSGYYYGLKVGAYTNQISLKYKYDGKNYEVGHYLPDRNVVLIYLNTTENWDIGLDNEYVLKILEIVKELVKKYKIEEVDTSGVIETLMLERFTSGVETKIRKGLQFIEQKRENIEMACLTIAKGHTDINIEKASVENLKLFSTNIKENMLKSIDSIRDLKFVKSADLTIDGIVLKFAPVFIKFKEKRIWGGNYTITILGNSFKIINSHPINNYHHLHISGSSICFGRSSDMVMKLLGNLELKKVAHFLWVYLNTFNAADTYMPMRDWLGGRNNEDKRDRTFVEIDEYDKYDEKKFLDLYEEKEEVIDNSDVKVNSEDLE